MDLRCNKTNCKFNDRFSCEAKEIHVSKDINCRTYEKQANKVCPEKLSKIMFEQAPEIAPFRAKANVKVECHANCLFNKEGLCKANGITVLDGKKDGICGTFIEE